MADISEVGPQPIVCLCSCRCPLYSVALGLKLQAAKPIVFFNFYVSFSLKISEFAASKVTGRHQSTRVSCE